MDDKMQRELMIAWHQFMEHDDELYYDNQPSLHFQSGFEAAVALLAPLLKEHSENPQ